MRSPRSPETLRTATLEEKLASILDSPAQAEWRLCRARELCVAAGVNGHLPAHPFVHFSRMCMEAGEFRIAKEAYAFGAKQEMSPDEFEQGVHQFKTTLENLDMDPVLIALAIRRKSETCLQRNMRDAA